PIAWCGNTCRLRFASTRVTGQLRKSTRIYDLISTTESANSRFWHGRVRLSALFWAANCQSPILSDTLQAAVPPHPFLGTERTRVRRRAGSRRFQQYRAPLISRQERRIGSLERPQMASPSAYQPSSRPPDSGYQRQDAKRCDHAAVGQPECQQETHYTGN